MLDLRHFKAAIFDLDGTLIHSEPAWEASKIDVLDEYGIVPSRALLDAYCGRGIRDFLNEAFGRSLTAEETEEIGNKIGARADILLPQMRSQISGASDLLCNLHDFGLKIAICSSSPRRHIVDAIDMLGIANRISALVSGAELPRGKPDPLPYLTTLELLEVEATSTCAFEDSHPGVSSATAAGLAVFAVGTGCSHKDFAQCLYRSETFEEILAGFAVKTSVCI